LVDPLVARVRISGFRNGNRQRQVAVSGERYVLEPVGWVQSPLRALADAPLQGDEGGADAWLVFEESFADALADLQPGADLLVLTWLNRARRDVLAVHPRGDSANPVRGVFSTRSPDRPNPIGLHRVRILSVAGLRIHVSDMEAIDGTPIVDAKPVLHPGLDR
jgi:tRNA-Thr(GGU) m(6)t(6)A37 methyltransferase TsaA